VFDRTFKASEKFKEPDLQQVSASYLYSDGSGSHFLDQESFETHTLTGDMMGNALEFLTEGALVELLKYNGNPIGLELPAFVELTVREAEPGVRGDSASGGATKGGEAGDGARSAGAAIHQSKARRCGCRPRAGSSGDGRTSGSQTSLASELRASETNFQALSRSTPTSER
jgi:hypothetical protein